MFRRDTVERLFEGFRDKRVLVVGDLMVDAYITGTVERISPEAPVPVLFSELRFSVPGGAANVANNLSAWGAKVALVGIVGDDDHGRQLVNQLDAEGIDVSHMVVDATRSTTVKTRVVAGNQQIVRVDTESRDDVSQMVQNRLIESVADHLADIDAVLISDYQKGVLSPFVVEAIIDTARQKGIPVICNPKPSLMPYLKGATLLSVNIHEARAYAKVAHCEIPFNTPAQLMQAAESWLEPLGVEYMMVTLGKDGCLVSARDMQVHQPAYSVDVSDTAGAGDTVIAMLALCVVSGVDISDAMLYANAAAGSVVRHVGVVPPKRDEVIQLLCECDEVPT